MFSVHTFSTKVLFKYNFVSVKLFKKDNDKDNNLKKK